MSKPEPETEAVDNNNPCLYLFYNVGEEEVHSPAEMEASSNYVKQVLPLAWSHNPLTALKLIFNLLDHPNGKCNYSAFFTAALWLHHNHPKTLLYNLALIDRSFGNFTDSMDIVYHLLREGQDINTTTLTLPRGPKRYQLLHKALKRYKRDPDYQLLHDQVSDLFVEQLKSDMEKLKFKEQNNNLNQSSESDPITSFAMTFRFNWPSPAFFTTLLPERFARKFFPPEEYHKLELGGDHGNGKGKGKGARARAKYADTVMVKRLKDEVLPALEQAYESQDFPPEASAIETYLEKVKASCCYSGGKISSSSLSADALLPHEITRYVHHWNFGRAAEIQWKSMVEDAYSKQGKFKNWLAVCDVNPRFMDDEVSLEVSIALGLLLSELDFEELFDLILQVAVNENLKPHQMIKKVLVLSHQDFDGAKMPQTCWENDYQAIQSKYKEKGYGDVVPHMVFWTLSKYNPAKPVAPRTEPGLSILNGLSNNLFKLFLDNEGEMGPDHLMELAVSDESYQALFIVD